MLIGLVFLMVGCAQTKNTSSLSPAEPFQYTHYDPLNAIQQEYYNVQTLYDGGRYPEAVQLGEEFVSKYKRDVLTVAVYYYIASSYQKIGNYDKAEELYSQILKMNADEEWNKLATVGLEEIKDARGTS